MNNNSTSFQANFSTASVGSPSTRVPRDVAITVLTLVAISILAGTYGNARVCILLRRRKDFRKVPHYLLGNLAVIGIFSALFNMPLLIVMTIVNYFEIGDMSVAEILCKIGIPSRYACMVVNALTLGLMAFDRYDCVVHPFDRRLTTGKVKKLIALTWIIALITVVLFAISIKNETSACIDFFPYNNIITDHGTLFQIVFIVVGQFDKITVLIVIVTFFRIMKVFRSSTVSPTNSSHLRREKKLTRLTFKLCGIFCVFRVPGVISGLFNVAMDRQFRRTVEAKTVRLILYAMVYFMYVANPVLHRKILSVRPPTQLGVATTRQTGAPVHMQQLTAVDARTENQDASDQS